jgi:hypothetical protein
MILEQKSGDDAGYDTNLMIVYFLLGVAGILFIIWIVLTIIRI